MTLISALEDCAWVCWKDLKEFSRSKDQVVMLVLYPLLFMVIFGFIFPNSNTVANQPIAVANLDGTNNGSIGYAIYDALNATNNTNGVPYFALKNATNTSEAAAFDSIKSEIQNKQIVAGIIIPANLTECVENGTECNITVITDQANPQMSLEMQSILSQVISYLGTSIAQKEVNATLLHFSVNPINVTPLGIHFQGLIPGNPSYFDFLAPGVLAIVIIFVLATGFPRTISYEKDIGTMDGLIMTPIPKSSIILGKTLAQTIKGLLQGLIALLVAVYIFGAVVNGSIALVFLVLFLCIFSFAGVFLLISSFADNETTATAVTTMISMPMMFLSGVFFPISQMPAWLQPLCNVLPMTYAVSALQKVMLLGAPISAIVPEIIYLIVFGTVFMILALFTFRRVMSR
jgi:ABC-2 type transport system permease protein